MSEKEYYRGRDEWFDKYFADSITPEFAEWWFQLYGHPDMYSRHKEVDEQDEYFVRMAFAFKGWRAHEDYVELKKLEKTE
jgi:hypothetical protein